MRIVLLADESFARREIEMLRRLEVGLLSQGHRVCLALPEAMLRESDALSLGSPTPYRLRGGPISRTHRIRQFLDRLDFEDSESSTDRAIDVVHVFGEQAWGFAARLATRVDAALVVECWSLAALHEASVLHRYLDPSATRTLWLAPSESMGRIAAEAMPKARIETCHWGVHIDEHPHHRDHARRHLVTQSEQRIVADEPVEEETG
ncbi:MAG: glycosyltransferase, partial [Planctomycetota bacterium]